MALRKHVVIIATTFLIVLCFSGQVMAVILQGVVYDSVSAEPIPLVSVRVEGTGQSMMANKDGQYRLQLKQGTYTIKFSHVAHFSETIEVTIEDSAVVRDVYLHPALIELPGTTVYNRAYDPGQEIIIKAIAHKEALLKQIKNYQFDAYTKLIMRKKKADSFEYFFITETQLTGYWAQPDKYKEVIIARRQSSNMKAEDNLVTISEIPNFNRNRLDILDQQIVSPTAHDALDFYNYYLLDTIYIDNKPVFKLEIEPKNNIDPLFEGTILIADTTYAVVGVDVNMNEGFDDPFIKRLHYQQTFAEFEDNLWMPIEIRADGNIEIPLPAFPSFTFDYVAALHKYTINAGIPPNIFDYVLEVTQAADDNDSTRWEEGQLIPLTEEEKAGYKYIDSLTHKPKSIPRHLLNLGLGSLYIVSSAYDFFHFNRVEGPYLGMGHSFNNILPNMKLWLRTGYAFDGKYWQHRYYGSYTLSERRQLKFGLGYRDAIRSRPTIMTVSRYNPTLLALISKTDPFDYYLEKGFDIRLTTKLLRKTTLSLKYLDVNQYSTANATDYSFIFAKDKHHRPNPRIVNGKLRSLSASFRYDSRDLMLNKGKEGKVFSFPFTVFEAGVETASPDIIDNDFNFQRYYTWLYHIRKLPGFGTTSLYMYAGTSNKQLPPQRYFTVDFGSIDRVSVVDFKTMGGNNFVGDKAFVFYLGQDFGVSLFRRSHLPLIEKIPFSLLVYGGVFWTNFGNESIRLENQNLITAPTAYSEIGFGLGRLPIIPILKMYFTWQLSTYDTHHFSFKISL